MKKSIALLATLLIGSLANAAGEIQHISAGNDIYLNVPVGKNTMSIVVGSQAALEIYDFLQVNEKLDPEEVMSYSKVTNGIYAFKEKEGERIFSSISMDIDSNLGIVGFGEATKTRNPIMVVHVEGKAAQKIYNFLATPAQSDDEGIFRTKRTPSLVCELKVPTNSADCTMVIDSKLGVVRD